MEPRSRGHAPFEKLLGEARRKAGLRTGRGEGAEPRATKGGPGGFLGVVGFFFVLEKREGVVEWLSGWFLLRVVGFF